MNPVDVIHEDNHLLVVNKPCGLSTQGGNPESNLHSLAARYLKERYHKPGNVYLGIVSRLDKPVSGVLVLARTSKSARRLNEQFAGGSVQKTYLAVVEGRVTRPTGRLQDWLIKSESERRMLVVDRDRPGSKQAVLEFTVLDRASDESLLQVEPHTGRKHQIRAQLAAMGHPVLGDRLYGGRRSWTLGIALHAWRIALIHPVQRTEVSFTAHLPDAWGRWKRALPAPPGRKSLD